MIVDRYYYKQLNKSEQAIYKVFYDGVMEHKDIIPIPAKRISQEQFTKIYAAITRDNPLIYHLNQSACNMAQDMFGHMAICPQYFFSKEKVKEYNKKIENAVNTLANQLKLTDGTDYEKALKVHDWFCKNVKYDEKGTDVNDLTRLIASHNIIGVFAHHQAQCEGIAKATKVILNAVGVRCIVATGVANGKREKGPHAWNIVNLDNTPYHMDITWDIGARNSKSESISYDYFNISDGLIGIDHKAEDKLPECKSLEFNYFTKNKIVFSSKTLLLAYVTKMISMGHHELYFRLEGKLNNNRVVSEIIKLVCKTMAQLGHRQVRVQQIPNEVIGTYWIKIN